MIPRYSRPEMTAVWSPETRFRIWFEIEAYASEAMAEIGVIPKAAAKASETAPLMALRASGRLMVRTSI